MKSSICAFSFFFLLTFASIAEPPGAHSLASPYATTLTHFGFLEPGNYHPKIAAQAFGQPYVALPEAEKLAIKLKKIIEKEGIHIDINQLPQEPNYIDPEAKYHRYQFSKKLPQVYLIKRKNKWVYSPDTVRYITDYQELTWKKLAYLFPASFRSTVYVGLYLWQYVTIGVLLCLLWLLYRIIMAMVRKLIHNFLMQWPSVDAWLIEELFTLVTIALLLIVALPVVQLPAVVEKYTLLLLQGLLAGSTTLLCYQLVNVLDCYFQKKATEELHRFHLNLLPLYRKSFKVLIVIVGVLATLRSLNFDIATVLTGVSIGGLGFALASQDMIKNFFGSLMILLDKPFRVGDRIVTGSIEGKVEEIGLRSTRIRTSYKSVIYIPNAKLADTAIDNTSLRKQRRFSTNIALENQLSPPLVEAFVTGLRNIARYYPFISNEEHLVYVNDLSESRLDIIFCVYFKAHHRAKELQYRHEVIMAIMKLAHALGIRFWLPTQQLHMVSFPEKEMHPPTYATDPAVIEQQLQQFLQEMTPKK